MAANGGILTAAMSKYRNQVMWQSTGDGITRIMGTIITDKFNRRHLRKNELLYQPDDPGVDPDNDANWDFMFSIVKIFFLALIVGCGAICVWLMSMVLYYG